MCQLTVQERSERHRELRRALAASHALYAPVRRAHADELAAAAANLAVDAREDSAGAPWVILGTVDGRGFYMRERWGAYDIVIAPDDAPGVQPWDAPAETRTIAIRSGHLGELQPNGLNYRDALTLIVRSVRSYLRRRACTHPSAPGDRYCRACGSALIDAVELEG